MRQNPVKREYHGTDGITYYRKAAKARKKLEARIKHYTDISKNGTITGFKRPGSMKCS